MINIVISPSQQKSNKCACCTSEKKHCREIAGNVVTTLKQDNNINPILVPDYSNDSNYLYKVVKFSDKYFQKGKSLHLDIHSDAFDKHAKGCSTFFFKSGGNGEKLAKNIYKELSDLTPWTDRSCCIRSELYVLRKTLSSAALVEVDFHDNVESSKWIHDNIKKISQRICIGIYSTIGISNDSSLKNALSVLEKLKIISDKENWLSKKIDKDCKNLILNCVKYINSNK